MARDLLIGGRSDGQRAMLDGDALTTHGVILGMTGSGKTGLAIVMLEELARAGVPLLVCDLKGDMANLLLAFPSLSPSDFAPYVPADQIADRDAAAAKAAARWRDGLSGWGLGSDEIRAMRERVGWRLLTPGSGLAPVSILPALAPPPGWDPDIDPDGARARLDGSAAALLALVGRGGDPLSNRDHVLVSALLDHVWREGRALDLAGLIRAIAEPPMSQLGVLDVESFYPRRERNELVLALNAVLASPAFAAWTRGVPLAIEELIGPPGAPRASILYLAHLGDRERLSCETLVFSTLLSWSRSQPGSSALRVLLYLDEVQGILPPSAMPPTKAPLLTLLKQGRAFGTGVLLATQNPVDLDYKALGNVGLKLIGRLDTENDRRRALEGLDLGATGAAEQVAALKPREFLLAGARAASPAVIASRWAMSYLRGPLTLAELKPLLAAAPAPPQPSATPPASGPHLPLLGAEQVFAAGAELRPAALIEGEVVFRKSSPSLERRVAGRWVAPLEPGRIVWERLRMLEDVALAPTPPPGARLAGLPGNADELVRAAAKGFTRELDSLAFEVCWHRGLKLLQEEGESREELVRRCRAAALVAARGREEQARAKSDEKLRRIAERLSRERLELSRDQQDLAARERAKQISMASGVGDALMTGLGALLGGRRGLATAVRRGASATRQVQEKQRMTERARAEVEESHQTIAQLEAEQARLQAELQAALAALRAEAEQEAERVETLRLTPAAKDISVRKVSVAWLPPEAW